MALKIPTSMDELLYMTNRLDGKFAAKAWAYKKQCPKCKKALMGKPIDPSTGKVKIRSTEYICPSCSYSEPKSEHEDSLRLEVLYTCPKCENKGEAVVPFKRKTFMGVKAFVVECSKCHEKMGITKKMKATKASKKKKAEEDDDYDDD
ncbi:MAG TPA: hypothetical protein VK158_02070 [Acidobacteriota bacterium]|nr:hypothetical protein [Acidobacteriota bacterium]